MMLLPLCFLKGHIYIIYHIIFILYNIILIIFLSRCQYRNLITGETGLSNPATIIVTSNVIIITSRDITFFHLFHQQWRISTLAHYVHISLYEYPYIGFIRWEVKPMKAFGDWTSHFGIDEKVESAECSLQAIGSY